MNLSSQLVSILTLVADVNVASPFHDFSSKISHVQLEKLKSEAFTANLGQLPFLCDENRKWLLQAAPKKLQNELLQRRLVQLLQQ